MNILFVNAIFAQQIDSTLANYADKYQPEKIHIHFDKSAYNRGESIYFKGYILKGSDLSYYSKNFYIDWFDENGKLLKNTIAPIYESSARGMFVIPSNYPGKVLHVRAYTTWMLNFDTAFLFNKDILIDNPTTKNKIIAVKPVATIQFFPEGGNLINGITSKVAFMAINQFGQPVQVNGIIKNNENEKIDTFLAQHDGMGTIALIGNDKEVYTAYWKDVWGNNYTTVLPPSKPNGVAMEVVSTKNEAILSINKTENLGESYNHLNVVATINQQEVYRAKLNMSIKRLIAAHIPTDKLPTGVLQITLFDADWLPIAERVVFINNHQHEFEVQASTTAKGLGFKQKNEIEITVPDSIGANLSISVTDAGLFNDLSTNIYSDFLLSGDIKGFINNPAYYFSGNNDSIAQNLDLVMLTHGWRRFKWDDITSGKLPTLNFQKDSDYLEIKGKVYGAAKKIQKGQTMNLILLTKDSSKQLLPGIPVSADGNFVVKGAIFYDTIKVFFQFNGNKSLTNRTEVKFQNGLPPSPFAKIQPLASSHIWASLVDTSQLRRNRFFNLQQAEVTKQYNATMLANVTVRGRAKTPAQILDEKYATGMFSSGDSRNFDLINDPFALSSQNVFMYLQGKVAGLQINYGGPNGVSLSWRGGHPSLFLDEFRSDQERILDMPMSDVAYIKVFSPPFFGAFGGGGGGAIAVYSRKGGDVISSPGDGLSNASLAGYTSYKEFYSPNYSVDENKPDVRTTLYWNPFVMTDKKNKTVKVTFYNNDISKKLRVIIEGVNGEGKLARIEKVIQ